MSVHPAATHDEAQALTAEQIDLCVRAQRAYYRACAALDTFHDVFTQFNDYRYFGQLPARDWEHLTARLREARAASTQFDALMMQAELQGIHRDTVMRVSIPKPVTELDLAIQAHREATWAVQRLLRPKPTRAQLRRQKAVTS